MLRFFLISVLVTSVFAVRTSTSEVPQDAAAGAPSRPPALRGAKVSTTAPSEEQRQQFEHCLILVFMVLGAALTALMTDQEYERYETEMELMRPGGKKKFLERKNPKRYGEEEGSI
eukprot:s237_g15.t1